MLLLNICAVTRNCKTIQVALCFLSSKKEADYDQAISKFNKVMAAHEIPKLDTWVTDQELTLINTLDYMFLNLDHLLCTWHVNMNILANCYKHFPADLQDLLIKTFVNSQGYVPNPKQTEFLKDQVFVVNLATKSKYRLRLTQFKVHKTEAVNYVKSVQLIQKEKLVRC